MTNKTFNSSCLLFAMPLLGAFAGCFCQAIPPLPGEGSCPTDARRLYPGAGEEAVRRCPCGPDRDFYGHKPTEWRSWPAGWRCGQYPYYPQQAIEGSTVEQLPGTPPVPVPVPVSTPEGPNPFRGNGGQAAPPASRPPVLEPAEIDFGTTPAPAAAQPVPPQAEPVPPKTDPVVPPDAEPAPPKAQPTPPVKTVPDQPESVEPKPAKPAPANTKQDWRSSADVINSMQQQTTPPPSAEPPTPGDELDPPIPPQVPPKQNGAIKGAFNIDAIPRLVPAQNAAYEAAVPELPATVPVDVVQPEKVPAKPLASEPAHPPINKRVADHLTHNLFK